jgi:WD40 repeat protein
VDVETNGRYAYWSPIGGVEPLAIPDPYASSVLASSGNVAAVVSPSEVIVLDIETGFQVAAFPVDLLNEPVRSACISPEQRFIAVVGDDGQAFIGNMDTNVADSLPKRIYGANSFGWATDDQLVYITDWEFATALNAYDATTAQNHHIADIADRGWSLATRSTC